MRELSIKRKKEKNHYIIRRLIRKYDVCKFFKRKTGESTSDSSDCNLSKHTKVTSEGKNEEDEVCITTTRR